MDYERSPLCMMKGVFSLNYIIDRFEGKFAVIELSNGTHANMPRVLIPLEAKEGDTLSICVDLKSTKERKEKIEHLMSDLFAD